MSSLVSSAGSTYICGERLTIEAGCEIQDKTSTCGTVSESNLKIHEGTTLLLFSQTSVLVFERFSALRHSMR